MMIADTIKVVVQRDGGLLGVLELSEAELAGDAKAAVGAAVLSADLVKVCPASTTPLVCGSIGSFFVMALLLSHGFP
jgi:hypothetical protein